MGNPSFPVVLTGDYSDGSICSAEEYRADFEKLRDAVNYLREKRNPFVFTGTEITYQDYAESYAPGKGQWDKTSGVATVDGFPGGPQGQNPSANYYKTLAIMQVPPWTQGVMVKSLQISNFSRVPNRGAIT